MPPFPESAKIVQVKGPCWVATVTVAELVDPHRHLAFRNLFLDSTGRSRLGRDSLYLPGTLLMLGAVQQVQITDTPYGWERNPQVDIPTPQTPAQIQAAIQAGSLSLLLVQADPETWPQDFPDRRGETFFPELTCLVGEIYLGDSLANSDIPDALIPTSDTLTNLYSALQLSLPADNALQNRAGAAHLLSALAVHGSGLSIHGQIQLPWRSGAIAAPFQLAKQITDAGSGPFRLTLERERLTPDEQQNWSAAWNEFSRYLNPLNPQNGSALPSPDTTPTWVTLEITDPSAVPNLFWTMAAWGETPVLNFDPNEINILLSDQSPYDQVNPPTSLGRLVPTWVTVGKLQSDQPDSPLRVLVDVNPNAARTSPAAAARALTTASRNNTVEYRFNSAAITPEDLSLQNLTIALDPTATPQALRQSQQLPAPQWTETTGPIQSPLIWGFMPLEDGWAQLPIPNLTEQIYLDSGVANLPDPNTVTNPTASPLQGAVSLGNNRRTSLERYPNEQPWNVTLTSLDSLQGQWLLNPAGAGETIGGTNGFTLSEVTLLIQKPEVTVTGLVWLSQSKPRIEDALPDLDDWVVGVRSHSLRTAHTDTDLFPPLAAFTLETLTLAVRPPDSTAALIPQLQAWKLLYTVQPATLQDFQTKNVLPANLFSQALPWVWQRHPSLPMVQALPLTQSQSPPNYPSASRQLIPFELPVDASGLPHRWYFGVGSTNGASQWPQFLGTAAAPAREWAQQFDLPLVSLSLPGLALDPDHTFGTPTPDTPDLETIAQLSQTYRFDLPYTDELNALADLPSTSLPPEQTSPLPDGIPPAPPQPLTRETFADHWQQLSQLASLARADAVTAFSLATSDSATEINTLIEPLTWAVQPTIDLATYPGRLTLANSDAPAAPGTITADASPLDISALAGISGQFSLANSNGSSTSNGPGPFQITAGSLVAHLENTSTENISLRDQRGLLRSASRTSASSLLHTPLIFQRTATEVSNYELTSLLTVLPLTVDNPDTPWHLWFRDIPINTATRRFSQNAENASRHEGRSPVAEDINDPDAFSRHQNFLSGYEWRLASGTEQTQDTIPDFLPLFNLRFYPLTLESVDLSSDNTQIVKLEMIGRLQLPLTDASELTDLSNAVRLTFIEASEESTERPAGGPTGGLTGLRLEAIALVADTDNKTPQNEWPLSLQAGEITHAPRLTWTEISLAQDSSGPILAISGVRIQFFLFNVAWSLPLSNPLEFPAAAIAELEATYDGFSLADDTPLAPQTVNMTLNLASYVHRVDLHLRVRLGSQRSPAVAVRTSAEQVPFTAHITILLLSVATAPSAQIPTTWESVTLFDDLIIDPLQPDKSLVLTPTALQLQWKNYAARDQNTVPQFLSGMPLADAQAAPGFAALTFEAVEQGQGDGDALFPTLQLKTAVVELLLTCQWGDFLQVPNVAELTGSDNLSDRVFKSSAGRLVVGYTTQWQTDAWQESFLLNGFLEVTNLISWPQEFTYLEEDDLAVLRFPALPPLDGGGGLRSLNHRRHTIRILFNQHQIPNALLTVGRGETLFQFAPSQAWQLLAVVEHQLVDIQTSPVQPAERISIERVANDRRWTVVQEVRLTTPDHFRQFLTALSTGNTLDPGEGIATLGAANQGYLSTGLQAMLLSGDSPALDVLPDNTLLVEASAPHWVNQTPVTTTSATTLQFLPNGNQLAILSNPQDYGPSDPRDPQWLLLTMPFLGRLQHVADDFSRSASPLQVDPIHLLSTANTPSPLALALTHWVEEIPMDILVPGLDTAPGRTWARLDPLTLEESWFRLQNPLPDIPAASSQTLQSVLAAFPNTPAQLSRSTALRYAFNPVRPNSPPTASNQRQPQPALATDHPLVWRQDSLLATPDQPSVNNGLQALYTFEEGSGNQVNDVSGINDTPLNLQILTDTSSPDITEWIPGGGLRIKARTLIRSIQPARRLTAACQRTNEITIIVWVKPASAPNSTRPLPQNGPARLVSLSKNSIERNITLGQDFPPPSEPDNSPGVSDNNFYLTRLRTTETTDNGLLGDRPRGSRTPVQLEPVTASLVPIIFTRAADGTIRLHTTNADGNLVETETTVGGTFRNWDDDFHLMLANEQKKEDGNLQIDDRRAWLGDYHLVAIYNRALSPTEVRHHIRQGLPQARRLNRPYPEGWYLSGLQLSPLLNNQINNQNPLERHTAATLIPTSGSHSQPSEMPLSLAVSPYLGLEFRPVSAAASNPSLISTELLCLDRTAGTLLPVASRLEEIPSPADDEPLTDTELQQQRENLRQRNLFWARETHQRLAPESAIALLRFREINTNRTPQSPTDATVTISYAFAVVTDLQQPKSLCQPVFRLRATPLQMRFREGQFGGSQLPASLSAFEIAPPQVTGVQPLYLQERPPTISSDTPTAAWPWGLSALRLSVQYTQEQQGITGPIDGPAQTRWWQAPHYPVQFRSTAQSDHPTAGLPANFRAAAIRSLLPVLPNPPLPPVENSGSNDGTDSQQRLQQWQPVLPGTFHYLLTGNRPGVPFAIRHQLFTQTTNNPSTLVSGSVPVQHRMPRPIPLPDNTTADSALQTWASYFHIQQSSLVSDTPADTAFFAECGTNPVQGLQMILQTPLNGAVTSSWNGDLLFMLVASPALEETSEQTITLDSVQNFVFTFENSAGVTISTTWEIQLTITDGGTTFKYQPDPSNPSRFVLQPQTPQQSPTLSDLLSSQALGDSILVTASVKPVRTGDNDNFRQTLMFPLRITDETTLPLPLRPQFIVFEDPEYNRLLISNAAHATRNVPVGAGTSQQIRTVTLSLDRREYNPDSVVFLRYDWDAAPQRATPIPTEATLSLTRISSTGAVTELTLPNASDQATDSLKIESNRLEHYSLAVIQTLNELQLITGDRLQFKLAVPTAKDDVEIVLPVDIINVPVIPVTQAAYGLLRHHRGASPHVECVRFAWSPEPTRIELICPKDLQTEVVRRRAVFHWSDSIRPGEVTTPPSSTVNSSVSYEIQKITQTGSTGEPNISLEEQSRHGSVD